MAVSVAAFVALALAVAVVVAQFLANTKHIQTCYPQSRLDSIEAHHLLVRERHVIILEECPHAIEQLSEQSNVTVLPSRPILVCL